MKEKNKLNIAVFKRLLYYCKHYKSLFVFAVFCVLILAILGPTRPYLIGRMVDLYIVKSQNGEMLIIWTIIIISILFLEALFQFLSTYFSNLFAQSIIRDLRNKLMKKVLSFRMKYFNRTTIGSLVTRVVSDLEAITEVFSSGLMSISGDLISLISVVSLMFWTNWKLSLLTLVPIPLLIIATRIFARYIRKSFQMERDQVSRLNTFVQERITGISLVQLFNRQEEEYESFKGINAKHRQAHIKAIWANSIFFPTVEILSHLSIAFLLVWTAQLVGNSGTNDVRLMFGETISFVLWIHMLYRPIRQLADKFNILQRGTVRAERVFEIIDSKENIENDGAINDCRFDQKIKFSNLYFAYQNEEWILNDINLEIHPGSTVAFVGSTGAGKSSLVSLIGRFYDYQKGSLQLGNIELNDIELNYLRKNIAIVLQDVFLFSESIFYNITLGDHTISREDVISASKAVGAHDFIMKFPGGYDYKVGERGGVLSTGQRQLISFIRVFVYNPKILILDEATSSVDNESEELIQKAIKQITKGRTSIIIAHRLSTIQGADKIFVLEKGEIKEEGTHSELLDLKGHYKLLHEMQFSS